MYNIEKFFIMAVNKTKSDTDVMSLVVNQPTNQKLKNSGFIAVVHVTATNFSMRNYKSYHKV